MKVFLSLVFAIFLVLIGPQTLFAMSIGRDGDPYIEHDVTWQNIKYKNHDAGFSASIPGSPTSGLSNDVTYCNSNYNGVDYEVHTSLSGRYTPPKTSQEFIATIESAFAGEATVQPIPSKQKKALYIVEIYFEKASKIARLYCSHNCLYWVIVEGSDLSLAPLFFDSFKITK